MICQIQGMHTLGCDKGYTEKIEISGYTFVRADDLTVGTDNEQNIVTVYYSKDTNEDDIPDKYQITFTYVSADDDKGNCDRNNQ